MGDRTGLPRIDRTNGFDDGRGYMKAKKSKLAQQNEQIRDALRQRHSAMRTELFKGVSINVNGRTQPTADELKRLILLNGGEYHPYYRYQQTKFMIATNLSTARIKNLRPDDRVVKPEWIVDSVKASCVLPYQDYQLFADEPRGQKKGPNGVLALESDNSNQASNHSLTNHSTTSSTSGRPQPTIQQLLQANAAKANTSTTSTSIPANIPTITLDTTPSPTKTAASDNNNRTTASDNNNRTTASNNNSRTTWTKAANNSKSINGGSQAATTSGVNNKNGKKQPTMNDFVVRGVSKAKFPTPKVKAPQQDVANIIGYTRIDDIVKLISEWVGCPEGVTDEDVACVSKYFYDLMGERNYHNKFCEVMEAFKQRVQDQGEKCWIDLYNDLARTFKNELLLNAEASQSLYQLITYIEPSRDEVPQTSDKTKSPSEPGTSAAATTSKERNGVEKTNAKIEPKDDDILEVIDID